MYIYNSKLNNMLTPTQKKKFISNFKSYRSKYIHKKFSKLDESATRLMINYFLTKVLGYKELDEIKTEYRIRSTYADYVIQIGNKQHIVVEVKAIELDISDKHIRQALHYAVDEGIDWVLLTNGREFILYKVIFSKPINYRQVFYYNIVEQKEFKNAINAIEYLHKSSVAKGNLNGYWKRCQATEPENLCKYLYKPEVIRFLRRSLKKEANLNFSERDVFDSVHDIVITAIESKKPKYKI